MPLRGAVDASSEAAGAVADATGAAAAAVDRRGNPPSGTATVLDDEAGTGGALAGEDPPRVGRPEGEAGRLAASPPSGADDSSTGGCSSAVNGSSGWVDSATVPETNSAGGRSMVTTVPCARPGLSSTVASRRRARRPTT
jgi:hypothetical protein